VRPARLRGHGWGGRLLRRLFDFRELHGSTILAGEL
jgi:hypothetical protein